MINIGYARAAAALSELSGHQISLEVPEVAIHEIHQITTKLQQVIAGEVVSINQVFSGPISGNAILILDREAAALLNGLLTDRPTGADLDGAAREVITEVGNIVLNACLGAFGNLLKDQVSFTVPAHPGGKSVPKRAVDPLLSRTSAKLEYALIIRHAFPYPRQATSAAIYVIILGLTSLKTGSCRN